MPYLKLFKPNIFITTRTEPKFSIYEEVRISPNSREYQCIDKKIRDKIFSVVARESSGMSGAHTYTVKYGVDLWNIYQVHVRESSLCKIG